MDHKQTTTENPDDKGRRLKPADAAEYLGVTPKWMERGRLEGFGPRFIRYSRQTVRYDSRDLDTFLAASRRRSTCDQGDQAAAGAVA